MKVKGCGLVLAGAAALLPLLGVQVHAEDVFVGSMQLRGGFDSNPTLAPDGRGAPFVGVDAAFAAGRDTQQMQTGIVGEVSRTEYMQGDIDPTERGKLTLKAVNKAQDDIAFRATTTVDSFRSYDTHAFNATQSARVQWVGGALRPFFTAEMRYASLNETNAIFPDFLPDDQRFVRATAIPGVAWTIGKAEVGTSLNLSMTRYLDAFDTFGFRRDNERIQPFLFGRYSDDGFNMFATVSRFHGVWHDPDFSDVDRFLYEFTLDKTYKAFTVELSARRVIGETTFPISPAKVVSEYGGKLTWAADEKTTLILSARSVHTEYLDSPFVSDALVYGVGATRQLADDLTLGVELLHTRGEQFGGAPAVQTVALVSLAKVFGGNDARGRAMLPATNLMQPTARALQVPGR